MRFLKDEDYHTFRALICTIFLVAIYLIQKDNFSINNLGLYTIMFWLYYCIVYAAADLYANKIPPK